jgi:hypothetical protein
MSFNIILLTKLVKLNDIDIMVTAGGIDLHV